MFTLGMRYTIILPRETAAEGNSVFNHPIPKLLNWIVFLDSIEKLYQDLTHNIDIINYREGLTDKRQHFT